MGASTDVAVDGITLHHATGDGQPRDRPDAQKSWVGASISIGPSATNNAVQPHTFTATLQKDKGNGLVPDSSEYVDFTLTDSNGANFTLGAGASARDNVRTRTRPVRA